MGSIVYDSTSGHLVEGVVWAFPLLGELEAVLDTDRVCKYPSAKADGFPAEF